MFLNKEMLKNDFKRKLIVMFSEDIQEASPIHQYVAFSSLIKDYLSENQMKTNKKYAKDKVKQVYYFSMEFLIGKLLENNLINMNIRKIAEDGLKELGIDFNKLLQIEVDAGLGNGGLGRLAACFLDSMASLSLAGHGNGIRYKYGLFEQKIVEGYQVEVPDSWLRDGYVWETRKIDKSVLVKFGGDVSLIQENGKLKVIHKNYEPILAVPYDIPIAGFNNNTVNNLRLWSAEAVEKDFDFTSFSNGDYLKAVEYKYSVEAISQVLYPDDSNEKGKMLRLKQEYFFVSAGIQSIIRRYLKMGITLENLDKYVAIHINDTHPSIAVAEIMRVLVDEYEMEWKDAWKVTVNVCAYTNHTIMAEALEKWPIGMFKKLLPRIYMIIEEINRRFCIEIFEKYSGKWDKVNKMSIIQDGSVRMAHLAIVGSHSTNGVAKLHTKILKEKELNDFNGMYPERFNNKTNGITHRRWLMLANPKLCKLICDSIGEEWIYNPIKLKELEKYSKNSALQEKFYKVKRDNKIEFSNYVKENYDIKIDPDSIYDIQAKRLHEYKRQLLNVFNIINLYNELLENPNLDITPRTFIFSAKASPGYHIAKKIIKFINTVADKINNDSRILGKIKIIFMENYSVSLAEKIIPCANVSEQISTASKEASGTGNMKFMMNGAITLATLDGANVEIREVVGDDNIVIFGLSSEQVFNYYKNGGYFAKEIFNNDKRINKILSGMIDGSLNAPKAEFYDIYDKLLDYNDEYFILKDFDSYVKAQDRIDKLYKNKSIWQQMSIINIANSGVFSSDNTVKEYAKDIWNIKKAEII
ncbi:glycogen/starch/alpha-glucan phosphorylase [Clostridium rectalis]|uniref:glycogen/starch/alpha-glucan phosphorylase n=1 Tax=Clostridium rectalis TaxID=2040295 RepID=UPI000F63D01B|nr:glycogen/starch/alpha-glucan phosphorylase [Clostridium rectalis]